MDDKFNEDILLEDFDIDMLSEIELDDNPPSGPARTADPAPALNPIADITLQQPAESSDAVQSALDAPSPMEEDAFSGNEDAVKKGIFGRFKKRNDSDEYEDDDSTEEDDSEYDDGYDDYDEEDESEKMGFISSVRGFIAKFKKSTGAEYDDAGEKSDEEAVDGDNRVDVYNDNDDDGDDDDSSDEFYRHRIATNSETDKRELQTVKIKRSEFLILAVRALAALVLLIGSLAIKSGSGRLIMLLAAALIIGADMLYFGVTQAMGGNIFNNNLIVAVAAIASFCIGRNSECVVALILYKLGEQFVKIAVGNATSVIYNCIDIRPKSAHILKNDELFDCEVGEIIPGDLFVVHPGERLPVDGVIVSGSGNVDASQVSGKALVLSVGPRDNLCAGSIVLETDITLRATSGYSDSTVAKILNIVDNAEEKKGDSERVVNKFSKLYSPCVCALAAVVGILVPVISGLDFAQWVARGVNILIVAAPGALLVSVPLAYYSGIGRAAVRGILFKGADVLDRTSKASTVVFDKDSVSASGTLTISTINPFGNTSQEEIRLYAAYALANVDTPAARCILSTVPNLNRMAILKSDGAEGRGYITVLNDGTAAIAGTREFLSALGIVCPYEFKGQVVYYVGKIVRTRTPNENPRKLIGVITIDNNSNANTFSAIREIRKNDVDRVILFTDDSNEAAASYAESIGITEYFAETPADEREARMNHLLEMALEGDKLVFVGDSDADAPLLKMAGVGVCVRGVASDEAVSAADVVLLSDEPVNVAQTINIAKGVQKVITFNMILALAVKFVLMMLSLGGWMLMWIAELLDLAVTLFTVVNSLRAFDDKMFSINTLPQLLNPFANGITPVVRERPVRQRDPNSPRARKDDAENELR